VIDVCVRQAPAPLVKLSKSRRPTDRTAEMSGNGQSLTGLTGPGQSASGLTGPMTGHRPGQSLTGNRSSQSVTGASGSYTMQSSTASSEVLAFTLH